MTMSIIKVPNDINSTIISTPKINTNDINPPKGMNHQDLHNEEEINDNEDILNLNK